MIKLVSALLLLAVPAFSAFPDICEKCWYEVPNSNLDTVSPSPTPPGWSGPDARMENNGGAFDTRRNRLIVTGGGGHDYSGNEIYAFDLDSLKWYRIKDGAVEYDEEDSLYAYYLNGGVLPDSQQPRPGFNYDQIEYDSTTDNLLIMGAPYASWNGTRWKNIFQLNMGTMTWSHPTDINSGFYGGNVSARDPVTGKIWFYGNAENGWTQSFNPSTGLLADHGNIWTGGWIGSYQNAAIMPSTNRMIAIGGGSATYWDIVTSGESSPTALETNGCDSLLAFDDPGFEWDPVQRKLVGWARGTHVITMDSTYHCEDVAPSDSNSVTPTLPIEWGTYGRWRYVPKYNVFVVVNSTSTNVFLYRPSAGTGTESQEVEITSPTENFLTKQGTIPVVWKVGGIIQVTGATETLGSEGTNLIVRCSGGVCDTVTVIRDQTAPVVIINNPGDTTMSTDLIEVDFTADGDPRTKLIHLNPGLNLVVADTLDEAGNRGADTVEITYAVPSGTPVWPSWSHLSVSDIHPSSLKISWTAAVDDSGISQYRIFRDSILIDSVPGNQTSYSDVGLPWDQSQVYKVEAGDLRGNWTTNGPDSVFSTSDDLPPNPEDIAPPLDKTVATTLFSAASFLFNDTLPIQTGMAHGIIDTVRTTVLRGTVKGINGDPLVGVSVSVLGAKAFGSTVTRENGEYDLMVNGGGLITLKMVKSGYLPIQRQLETPWNDYVNYPEAVMLQLDSTSQVFALDSSEPMQVFRSSEVSDSDGARRATLLIPENTTAQVIYPDGTTQPLASITMRATEFTVGSNGPKAMPADLPLTSSYTYAVEFSADEAMKEGTSIIFSQAIFSYLENFVGIPVGWNVPSASYDRKKGYWVPEANGRVIKIHSIVGGKANVIIDEGGIAADSMDLVEMGFTEDELENIASLYSAGDSLWRVPVCHFSVWDFNFKATSPDGRDGIFPSQKSSKKTDKIDEQCGSVIGCQSQTLGESFPITGTPFRMHYSSNRVKGRKADYIQHIQVTNSAVPFNSEKVLLEIEIAGRHWEYQFEPNPNIVFDFEWDGLDIYNRVVQGTQPLKYRVGYSVPLVYIRPPDAPRVFGTNEPGTGDLAAPARTLGYEGREFKSYLGNWNNLQQKLGGWSIDVQHAYDPSGKILEYGSGDHRNASDFGMRQIIKTVAGNGDWEYTGEDVPATSTGLNAATSVSIAPDGSLYISDYGNGRVRKVDRKGNISTVAGNGFWGYSGDGGLATEAEVVPYTVTAVAENEFYINDGDNGALRKVDSKGIISTIQAIPEGLEDSCFCSRADSTSSMVLAGHSMIKSPDGSIYYIALDYKVKKISTDGTVKTIAGNGSQTFSSDSIPATEASLFPFGIDLDRDGNLYIADAYNARLFKVTPEGLFTTIGGTGSQFTSEEGVKADVAGMQPWAVKVVEEEDGRAIYLANRNIYYENQSIKKINSLGFVVTIVDGSRPGAEIRENGPPTNQKMIDPRSLVASKTGEIYFSDVSLNLVRVIQPFLPGFKNASLVIHSENGDQAFVFDAFGKHLETKNGSTGGVEYSFEYDNSGLLQKIIDGIGNETSFERDAHGDIEKIISPYGQETLFQLNDSGYISEVQNPTGEVRKYEYSASGLLTKYTTPKGHEHKFYYDSLGRLERDEDPAGGFKELSRTETESGTISSLSTALGRVNSYRIEETANGGALKVNTNSAGFKTKTLYSKDGSIIKMTPDSSKFEVFQAPDPRFGMQSPYPESTIVTLPSGKKSIVKRKMGATFANPSDPLTLQTLSDTMVINGRVFKQEYESVTRTQTLIGPEGRTVKRTLDSLGRIIGERVGGLDTVRYSYDARGRLDSLIRGTGLSARTVALEYDEFGHLSNLTDELNRVFVYEYDAAGRRTNVILPDTQELSFAYDSSGNMTSVTPPGKPMHSFEFNSLDLQSEYAPPSLGAGRWATGEEYNLDKQIVRVVRPESTQIEFAYDSAGRVTSVQIPDATIRYSYDVGTGKIDSILSRDSISNAFKFDGSLLTKETLSGPVDGEIAFRYNSDFRVDSLGVNGVFVNYDYDQEGLLTQAGGLSLVYGTENSLLRKTTFAGLKDTLAYNGFGELIRQSDSGASGLKYAATFQRDKLGRILEKLETVTGTTTRFSYDYDAQGRLVQVLVDSTLYSRYHYDGNGNRLARVVPGDSMVGTYDNQDRLSHYGSLAYLYTSNGDLSATVWGSDTTKYAYDVLGNLLSVQMPGGPLIEYLIDGKNRRVGKKVNGTLVQGFLYQNQLKPVAELDGSGNVVARFVYASKANVPDMVIKGGITYKIISDYLGSPRLVINSVNDSVVQRLDYDEFGNLLQNTNPGFQPFGFAGGLYDSHTSLVRFGARDYNSWSGRWTAKDPIGLKENNTNAYAYVENDPVNWIDADGKDRHIILSYDPFPHVWIQVDLWDPTGEKVVGQRDLNFTSANGITAPYSVDPVNPTNITWKSFTVSSNAEQDKVLLNDWKLYVDNPEFAYTLVINCGVVSILNLFNGINLLDVLGN